MALRLGDLAPDFTAACYFPDSSTDDDARSISFSEFCAGSWVILFSHPADFTPVCTTELARVHQLQDEWTKRGCRVIGLSTDHVPSHRAWARDICEYAASTSVSCSASCSNPDAGFSFPIIADFDLKVAEAYGMLDTMQHDPTNFDPKTRAPLPIRTVFILDPRRRIRATIAYPAAIGRNFDEILRALDALQRTEARKIATPADWQPGNDVIIRFDVDEKEAASVFPDSRAFKPYLRFTPDQQ